MWICIFAVVLDGLNGLCYRTQSCFRDGAKMSLRVLHPRPNHACHPRGLGSLHDAMVKRCVDIHYLDNPDLAVLDGRHLFDRAQG